MFLTASVMELKSCTHYLAFFLCWTKCTHKENKDLLEGHLSILKCFLIPHANI